MNALIIEPSRSYRQLLQTVFENYSFQATAISSREEAQHELASNNFQIICLSMTINTDDSFDLCRQIRAIDRTSSTPIMMLTSSCNHEISNTAYSAGVTELFLKKDFDSFEAYLSGLTRRLQDQSSNRGSILYVEDSLSVAALTMGLLDDQGYHVDHYTTAEEAITALSEHYYDLLLTDVVLESNLSGLSIVRALRSHISPDKNQLPVLAMSAYQDNARKLELFNAGINDYVTKPVVNEELIARVNVLISNRQLLIELQNKQQQLQLLAMTDQLTQLYNRHYLMDIGPKKISQAKRQQHPLSLLVVDIDKFKIINDTHGHDTGDKVLSAVARLLARESRLEDIVARFGGEEFVIILDHCDLEQTLAKAEKMRAMIEALVPCDLPVTASFGATTLSTDDNDFDCLFLRADKAVYQAKENGRNQVAHI